MSTTERMNGINDKPDGLSISSLPISNPCLSYWQRTTRAFPHLNSNRDGSPPGKVDYVIVGSGLSGALTAFELIENGIEGERILILEAREAASGASSRNAGHVRPDAFRGFYRYSARHGPKQALEILTNERLVLEKVNQFVQNHSIDCDFDLTTTFDVCMTEDFAAHQAKAFSAVEQAGGDLSHVRVFHREAAAQSTRVADAIAAYEWPAGSIHPAKLTHWLLNAVIEKGCRLFTSCPVTQITRTSIESGFWCVTTPRGEVTTSKVVHCTNAYASLLLPLLKPHLTPNRAQAHSLKAPLGLSEGKLLTSTFSLRYSLSHFYSLIQRSADGTLILGASRTNPNLSAETIATRVTFDDSSYNVEILKDALRQWDVLFPNEETKMRNSKAHGEGLDQAWTGIIGLTGDHVPFVGQIEGLEGQFVCAGFGGHGMARIFTCAPGVAKLVLGKSWVETGLPECFMITEGRLSRMNDAR